MTTNAEQLVQDWFRSTQAASHSGVQDGRLLMSHRWISALLTSALLIGQTAPAFAYDRDHNGWNDDRQERRWDDRDDRRNGDRRVHDRWDRAHHDDDRRDGRDHRGGRHWRDDDRRTVVNRYYYAPPAAYYRGKAVRYVSYPRQNVVYYYDRPDVVYVRGAPQRYYYDNHRRGYYYRDERGNSVLLGAAIGAIGLAAVLAASR